MHVNILLIVLLYYILGYLRIHPDDGDTMGATVLLGDDVIEECKKSLEQRETYITGRGEFLIDLTNDTLDFVLKALTS